MIQYLRKVLDLMRKRAERNLEIIHINDQIVKAMLEEPISKERTERIEERYQENKKLLKENNDSMQIQFEITRFIENYHRELEEYEKRISKKRLKKRQDQNSNHSRENILELTISGEIPFNEKHPYFRDEEFFNALLSYYKNIEDYETCNTLINKRNKKS
jgi:hypothetical protein